jgi:hypothetical protein
LQITSAAGGVRVNSKHRTYLSRGWSIQMKKKTYLRELDPI